MPPVSGKSEIGGVFVAYNSLYLKIKFGILKMIADNYKSLYGRCMHGKNSSNRYTGF